MGLGSGSLGCTRRRGSAGTSCPSYADPSSSPERRRSSSRRDTARGFALAEDDYREASPLVRFGSYEEALSQDVIVVLRCPDERALRRLRPGAVLVSMLHFPTAAGTGGAPRDAWGSRREPRRDHRRDGPAARREPRSRGVERCVRGLQSDRAAAPELRASQPTAPARDLPWGGRCRWTRSSGGDALRRPDPA